MVVLDDMDKLSAFILFLFFIFFFKWTNPSMWRVATSDLKKPLNYSFKRFVLKHWFIP